MRKKPNSTTPTGPSFAPTSGVFGEEIFRLSRTRLTLAAIAVGTVLGFLGGIGVLLGWFGVSLDDLVPGLKERLAMSPGVLAIALGVLCLLWLGRLAHQLVYEVQVAANGAVHFRTLLQEFKVAARDPLTMAPMLGLLWVRSPAGQGFLLPELARMKPLLAHLDRHPTSPSDPQATGEALEGEAPPPLPRGMLDTSAWRIVKTDTMAFWIAVYGVVASLMVLVAAVFVFVPTGWEAVRPDGSVRPLEEIGWILGTLMLIPPLTVTPFLAFRVARWRRVLRDGTPLPGRIDDVASSRGELLVRFSYEVAGERQRVKILSRPTPEAKALRVGAPAVILVRPDQPRKALPEALFVRRNAASQDWEGRG